MGRGDVKNRDEGDAGCEELLQKSYWTPSFRNEDAVESFEILSKIP